MLVHLCRQKYATSVATSTVTRVVVTPCTGRTLGKLSRRAVSLPRLTMRRRNLQTTAARRSWKGERYKRERSLKYRDHERQPSLLDQYLSALDSHPLLTKSLTSMAIVGFGDAACQILIEPDQPFNWKRLAIFSALGGVLVGPGLHLWYGLLNRLIPGTSTVSAIKRLALDQTIFASSFIPIFLSSVLVLEGKSDEVVSTVRREWFPSLVANWQLWIPGNFINFRFVAPRFQVLFANVVALVWNSYLSWASHRGTAVAEQEATDSMVVSLFNEFDKDSNGKIDISEFQDLAFECGESLDERQVRAIVARLDKDGDGEIDMDEFHAWFANRDSMQVSGTDTSLLFASVLKARLFARHISRKVRDGATSVTGAPKPAPFEPPVKVRAPRDSHIVRRKTRRIANAKALQRVPTESIMEELAVRIPDDPRYGWNKR